MSKETLDTWLPPELVKRKNSCIAVQEECARCGNKINPVEPKYRLKIKGKEAPYCMSCAKAILRPQENAEENL